MSISSMTTGPPGAISVATEVGARLLERGHMVQRDDRDRGVERATDLEQRAPPDVAARFRDRVDRGHRVASIAQGTSELPPSRSDLQHARGRLRQRRPDERQQVTSQHARMITHDPKAKRDRPAKPLRARHVVSGRRPQRDTRGSEITGCNVVPASTRASWRIQRLLAPGAPGRFGR
jgi:hypothetical protein